MSEAARVAVIAAVALGLIDRWLGINYPSDWVMILHGLAFLAAGGWIEKTYLEEKSRKQGFRNQL